jgi:CIC family chloride channel protein
LLLFEMTNDYHIILPLMFAVFVSLVVAQRLQPESVYALGLARKGVRLRHGRDVDVLEGLTVSEVMQPDPPVVVDTDPLAHAVDVLTATRRHGLPVLNGAGDLVGIITVQDVDRALEEAGAAELQVGAVCSRDLLVAYPDESVGTALRRMSVRDVGRLPVVARAAPRRLVGLLRRNDLVRAYDVALTRRATRRHSVHHIELGSRVPVGVMVEAFEVADGAACAHLAVAAVPWPRDCVLVSLRRGRETLIPHGDTLLHPGDQLVVAGSSDSLALVRALCLPPIATETIGE